MSLIENFKKHSVNIMCINQFISYKAHYIDCNRNNDHCNTKKYLEGSCNNSLII